LQLLHRTNKIGTERTRTGGTAFKTQFGDAALYEWLMAVGLTPRKSLTLGSLRVPDEHVLALARGLLDGDGSIINKTYRANTRSSAPYYWEYLLTRFISASKKHLEWLQRRLSKQLGIRGWLGASSITTRGTTMWALTYAKRESCTLLPALYADPSAPCLIRKRAIWLSYVQRHGETGIE
jgi:hypothetical protein